MTIGQNPTVRRRRLGTELRRLREASGVTADTVAEQLEWSRTKVWRIETGKVPVRAKDVSDLCEIYGADVGRRDALMTLARESKTKGWWASYSAVLPDPYAVFTGLEADATSLRSYEPELVPGLLQTADYMHAVLRATAIAETPDEIERRVEVRLARQQVLDGTPPPQLWAVMNESVLRRAVGGRDTMRAQLRRLRDAGAEMPNVTMQVLPFGAGAHASMDGPFVLLGFREETDREVVYLENLRGGLYLERTPEVDRYTLVFDHLRAKALDPDASIALISEVLKE